MAFLAWDVGERTKGERVSGGMCLHCEFIRGQAAVEMTLRFPWLFLAGRTGGGNRDLEREMRKEDCAYCLDHRG